MDANEKQSLGAVMIIGGMLFGVLCIIGIRNGHGEPRTYWVLVGSGIALVAGHFVHKGATEELGDPNAQKKAELRAREAAISKLERESMDAERLEAKELELERREAQLHGQGESSRS